MEPSWGSSQVSATESWDAVPDSPVGLAGGSEGSTAATAAVAALVSDSP